jgi:hypothetical protein
MIEWTSVSTDNIRLDFSTDDGATWNEIVRRVPAYAGSFEWTIPNRPAQAAWVRIRNEERPRFTDLSDGPFSIKTSSIMVLSPNGGETYDLNQPINVTWTATNTNTVRVDFSRDNGLTWETVAQGISAGVGTHTFTPAQIPTKLALVRVVNEDREMVSDRSDKVFEIMEPKSITVYAPGEGDQLLRGSTTTIFWTAPRVNSVSILYSSNGGSNWTTIVSNVSAAIGSYQWNVPNTLTTKGKIRVQEVGGQTIGESGIFAIVDQVVSSLRVIRPNGGESYTVGDQISVQWSASPDLTKISVLYSTNSGSSWTLVDNSVGASVGQYSWTAPNIPGTQYRVKVDAGSVSDESDADFTVNPVKTPRITVLWPNGGENLTIDSMVALRWSSQDVTGMATISYSTNNGGTWSEIGVVDVNTGTYDWQVPNVETEEGLIRVAANDNSATDASNGTFTMSPKVIAPIVVTSPNLGTEVWMDNTFQNITWDSPADVTQVEILYSVDGGVTWKSVAESASMTGANSYSWKVPADTSSNALVRVRSKAEPTRYDDSDQPFSIVFNPSSVSFEASTGGATLSLMGNFPNPFATETELRWMQSFAGSIMLSIYDNTGRLVRQVSLGRLEAGVQSVDIPAGALGSGVYFYELRNGAAAARGVMMIAR